MTPTSSTSSARPDPGSQPVGTSTADPTAFSSGEVAPGAFFEQVYRTASGEAATIPWAKLRPNPMLTAWLNIEAPGLVRPGGRVVVVGCGLGDDVAELAGRGYDVLGFDVSPTAVEWARRRFPALSSCFTVADLLHLPTRLRHRFDLVIEISTLQALPPGLREDAARAVASLAGQRGTVLAICRARDESELLEHIKGPPWPLTIGELTGLMELGGLRPIRPIEEFTVEGEQPPSRRFRGAFSR